MLHVKIINIVCVISSFLCLLPIIIRLHADVKQETVPLLIALLDQDYLFILSLSLGACIPFLLDLAYDSLLVWKRKKMFAHSLIFLHLTDLEIA